MFVELQTYSVADTSQMADLKENIENEVHNAKEEFLKMDSHIKLYINEMEQAI
jgi:kinetochore protein Nuf2